MKEMIAPALKVGLNIMKAGSPTIGLEATEAKFTFPKQIARMYPTMSANKTERDLR